MTACPLSDRLPSTAEPPALRGLPSGALPRAFGLLRPLPALLLASAGLHAIGTVAPNAGDPKLALVQSLARDFNLSASPSDVFWIDPPAEGWTPGKRRAWVLAQHPNALNDVFLVHAQLTPEGRLLGTNDVFNATETRAADEASLSAAGSWAAWSIGDAQRSYLVQTADLDASPSLRHFTHAEQWRWRLAWLQRYGQLDGLTQRTFKLDPAPRTLKLTTSETELSIRSDGAPIVVPRRAPTSVGTSLLVEQSHELPPPGNWVTWAVDRVRAISWFGDDRMQWVKAVAYHAKDWLELNLNLQRDDSDSDEFTTRVDLPVTPVTPSAGTARPFETRNDWPPQNITPELDPPWEHEGVWQSLQGDPFVRSSPEPNANFLTTFIRTDAERKFSRILVVLWDPSRIELNLMSGTEEPKSATGQTGPGQIPRDPEILGRLVAAFNGGFQGTHGDFGMMVDGTEYVPPKPYAATVARMSNGETAFGTWPVDGHAPPDMVGYRQNLTPLVGGGELNPYGRLWWGGVPQGWQDDTQTVRSGLCHTKQGFIAYFYGTKTDAQHLGRAMLAANCEYGMHLDMNQGHTGLEFYIADEESKLPPLGLPLQGMWQAEGPLRDAPGFAFRGRRLFRGMQLMNFPRYIGREARDFFYLTLRRSLPSPNLRSVSQSPRDGVWETAELPQFGSPPVQARTSIRPDPTQPGSKVHLLQLDPYRLAPRTEPDDHLVASWAQPAAQHELAVWWDAGRAVVSQQPPSEAAVALLGGTASPSADARAAAAVDARGMVLYAEIATLTGQSRTDAGAELLRSALQLAGASRLVYLRAPAGVVLGNRDLSLHPQQVPSAGALHVVRVERSGFQDVFKDTPVVKREEWRPLQK